ncbi:MAG: coenzyme F420-0:L-glutamate ligase [Hyphomicrobiaceae bacterium]
MNAKMPPSRLDMTALRGVAMVAPGDDMAALIVAALNTNRIQLVDGDVVVIAQKVVSKAEGRLVDLRTVDVNEEALQLAQETEKDPRLVTLILSEARRVVRVRPGLIVVEHRLGFVMANAGIDQSNVGAGIEGDESDNVLLLPLDPDRSAAIIRRELALRLGAECGVVICDSFGRPWRQGTVGVAIGLAGFPALLDLRGWPDLDGRPLAVSITSPADEVAAAASLLMGQGSEGQPIVHVRGLNIKAEDARAVDLVRPAEQDLFR